MKPLAWSLFFFSCLFNCIAISVALDWQELKSEHFIVYFTKEEKFAKDLLYKSEDYYKRIASDIGYPRYSGFWTWENRVRIYIYPDHSSFLKATGQPNWSLGMADYKNKKIVSYAWSSGFLEALLPHEMTHLIFRDFVGFKGEVPLWLDEGIAQWEEEAKRIKVKASARQLLKKNMLLSLEDLTKLDIRKMQEGEGENLVHAYYVQAASLVGFLIERYGSASFADFCRQLRDGKSLEEALGFAYPTQVPNLRLLEKEWRGYLLE